MSRVGCRVVQCAVLGLVGLSLLVFLVALAPLILVGGFGRLVARSLP